MAVDTHHVVLEHSLVVEHGFVDRDEGDVGLGIARGPPLGFLVSDPAIGEDCELGVSVGVFACLCICVFSHVISHLMCACVWRHWALESSL